MAIIADGHTIINTQGIRYVEKRDVTYGGPTHRYELVVTYKGNQMQFSYPSAALRDVQFAALSKAMTAPRLERDTERTA
jgi:uncharacterized protein YbaA (DUF1428 family)